MRFVAIFLTHLVICYEYGLPRKVNYLALLFGSIVDVDRLGLETPPPALAKKSDRLVL